MRPLIKHVSHSQPFVAFSFEAFIAALVITFGFVLDDLLQHLLERYAWSSKTHRRTVHAIIHAVGVFISTLTSIYLLRIVFGYGDVLIPRK